MSGIPGTNISAPVTPFDTLDTYPTHDAQYGKGGYRSVLTAALRDAIPLARKTEGMRVRVTADPTTANNGDWDWFGNVWLASMAGVSDNAAAQAVATINTLAQGAASSAAASSSSSVTAATAQVLATAQAVVSTTQAVASQTSAAAATAAKTAAEAARDAANVNGKIYATAAAGLSAVASGGYFSVPSADSAEYSILYLNNAGEAVEQKRYPGAAIVNRWRNSGEVHPQNLITAGSVLGQSNQRNMLDGIAFQAESYLDGSGTPVAYAGYSYSIDFIPLRASTLYSLSSWAQAAGVFYDANKVRLSALTGDDTNTAHTFTSPVGTAFVRVSLPNGGNNLGEKFLVLGDVTATTYGKEFALSGLNVEQVYPSQLAGARSLVNQELLTGVGYKLNAIYNMGVEQAYTGWKRTVALIPVQPGKTYTKSANIGSVVYFDATKRFVGGVDLNNSLEVQTFTIPNGVRFVALSMEMAVVNPSFKAVDVTEVSAVSLPWLRVREENIEPGGLSINRLAGESVASVKNLLAGAAYTAGAYLDNTGVAQPYATFKYTKGFIAVLGGSTLTKSMGSSASGCFYDKDKVFLSGIRLPDPSTNASIVVPDGAHFARFNISNDEASPFVNTTTATVFSGMGVRQAQIIDLVFPTAPLPWAGKKIAWYGTSIPAGYPQADREVYSYANKAVRAVGGTPLNYAVSNGLIRSANANGSSMGGRDTLSFTNLVSGVNYQNSMVGLIGTANEPDYFVFDYGVNDTDADMSDVNLFNKADPFNAAMSIISRDKNTFIGATNWTIGQLRAAKPRARFAFVAHFSEDHQSTGYRHWRKTIDAQEALADYWGVPILKMYQKTGWIYRNGVDTLITYMTDQIHPATDATGQAVEILTAITTDWLRGIK